MSDLPDFIQDGQIVGKVAFRFTGPRATDDEFDDIADEYAVVLRPDALCGVIVFARYGERWEANPWNERPVVRELIECIARQQDEIEQLSKDRYAEARRVDWIAYAKSDDLHSMATYDDRRAFIDRKLNPEEE